MLVLIHFLFKGGRWHHNDRMLNLEEAIRENTRALGFSLVGIAPATQADNYALYQSWVQAGFAGEMRYMYEQPSRREHPRSVLPSVRSVIMVAMEYNEVQDWPRTTAVRTPGSRLSHETSEMVAPAKISRYAAGSDYHIVLRQRLNRLLTWLKTECPNLEGRVVVDTAPLLERDFARRAGLGWIGKNTMLINKRVGSYFFLGALLTNLELTPDIPHSAQHCGKCTACLDACPTSALVQPGQLDARRCISYLTIELRGTVPEAFRTSLHGWIFGCDICQEVCPWNHRSMVEVEMIDALAIVQMDEEGFQKQFGSTAVRRAKRGGLVRNAVLHLGNYGDERAIPYLERCLCDPDGSVREAATWALAQIHERVGAFQQPSCPTISENLS